jgi:hypothetical protein
MAEVDRFRRDFLVGALHNKYVPSDADIKKHPHARAIRELQAMACDYGLPTVGQFEEVSWAPKPDMEYYIEQLTRLKCGVGAFGVGSVTVFGGHTLALPDTGETLDWRGMLLRDEVPGGGLYFPAYLGSRLSYSAEFDLARKTDNYYRGPVFARLAGRRFAWAGHTRTPIPGEYIKPGSIEIGPDPDYDGISGDDYGRISFWENPDEDITPEQWEETYGEAARAWRLENNSLDRRDNVVNVIHRMIHDEGIIRFVIKATRVKSGIAFLDFSENADYGDIARALDGADLGWAPYGHPSGRLMREDALLVQERIPIGYEYRFLIVNHELITGAGCVFENTPLDNEGEQFHPTVARDYHEQNDIIDHWDESIHGKLLNCAKQIVEATRQLEPDVHSYCVDVGINLDTGQPVMIERNPLSNAGLYASNFSLVAGAIHRTATEAAARQEYPFSLLLNFYAEVADEKDRKRDLEMLRKSEEEERAILAACGITPEELRKRVANMLSQESKEKTGP